MTVFVLIKSDMLRTAVNVTGLPSNLVQPESFTEEDLAEELGDVIFNSAWGESLSQEQDSSSSRLYFSVSESEGAILSENEDIVSVTTNSFILTILART